MPHRSSRFDVPPRSVLARALAGAALLPLLAAPLAAATLRPLGPEQRADTRPFNPPQCSRVAARPDGSFAVAWDHWLPRSAEGAGDPWLSVRAYDRQGRPRGAAERIAVSYPLPIPGPQLWGFVGTAGGYDLAWQLEYGNFVRRALWPDGSNATRQPQQLTPADPATGWVWELPNGRLLLGTGSGALRVELRLVDLAGRHLGPPQPLQSQDTILYWGADPFHSPHVAPLADGGFAAAWFGQNLDPAHRLLVLRVRRFSAAGHPLGADRQVVSLPAPTVRNLPWIDDPFVLAAAPDGGFAVAFGVERSDGTHGWVRFYDAAGNPRGGLVALPSLAAGGLGGPPVAGAFDGSGRLLLLGGEAHELRALVLDRDGTVAVPATEIAGLHAPGSGELVCPDVAAVGGRFVAAWTEVTSGVYLRRLAVD